MNPYVRQIDVHFKSPLLRLQLHFSLRLTVLHGSIYRRSWPGIRPPVTARNHAARLRSGTIRKSSGLTCAAAKWRPRKPKPGSLSNPSTAWPASVVRPMSVSHNEPGKGQVRPKLYSSNTVCPRMTAGMQISITTFGRRPEPLPWSPYPASSTLRRSLVSRINRPAARSPIMLQSGCGSTRMQNGPSRTLRSPPRLARQRQAAFSSARRLPVLFEETGSRRSTTSMAVQDLGEFLQGTWSSSSQTERPRPKDAARQRTAIGVLRKPSEKLRRI